MENEILNLFTTNNSLKFSEIEKKLDKRSNLISYHLSNLIKKGLIDRDGENKYKLTEKSETNIPYLSDKSSPLPVILIKVGNSKSVFLYKRWKRPYKGFLSLPGGRMLVGESPEESAKRIMIEKFKIEITNPKIKSICLEHVKKHGKIIHSFILILIEAKSKKEVELTNLKDNQLEIIKSDYLLIKTKRKTIFDTINSKS